jgi:hypothetical protein
MKIKVDEKGVSLIETITYVSILTVIILIILSFFIWAMRSNMRINAMKEVLSSNRSAMQLISQEIMEANSIYYPTSSSTQLSLETSKYIQSDEEISYIDFFICGTRLCMKKEALDPVAITADSVLVSDLRFNWISTSSIPSIQIYLETKYKANDNSFNSNVAVGATSTAALRVY